MTDASLPPAAYGYALDSTYNREMEKLCAGFNKRSIRHASMTEEDRRADDFNDAWNYVVQSYLEQREVAEELERKRYRGHRIEEPSVLYQSRARKPNKHDWKMV